MLSTFKDMLKAAVLEGRFSSALLKRFEGLISNIRHERRATQRTTSVSDRYSSDARLAFLYAREEQQLMGRSHLITAEHILLGVLRDPKVYVALLKFGCTLEAVREKVKAVQGVSAMPRGRPATKLGTETHHLMELASALARANNDQVIGPSHMLLAVLEQPSSLAFQVLVSFATPEQIRSAFGTSSDPL